MDTSNVESISASYRRFHQNTLNVTGEYFISCTNTEDCLLQYNFQSVSECKDKIGMTAGFLLLLCIIRG
jgi:hypothetical protein